ncbi:uncharacterized protein LOC112197685 [Rosa chinensis]|uniref:uncharacterized protein LOC112197685 n=1 Tax=Rosa chinensis TaxID=74649 RepID=UPI001AD8D102|nr:uncharacterized protein LOC112197685 [Rosa chinensis]
MFAFYRIYAKESKHHLAATIPWSTVSRCLHLSFLFRALGQCALRVNNTVTLLLRSGKPVCPHCSRRISGWRKSRFRPSFCQRWTGITIGSFSSLHFSVLDNDRAAIQWLTNNFSSVQAKEERGEDLLQEERRRSIGSAKRDRREERRRSIGSGIEKSEKREWKEKTGCKEFYHQILPKALAHFFQSKFLVITWSGLRLWRVREIAPLRDFMQKNLSIVLLLLFLCLSISVILLFYCYSEFRNSLQADSSVVLH